MAVLFSRFVLLLALGAASATQALDISTCGVAVPARETGVLQADLVCTGEVSVQLGAGATFDLNGHTLTKEGIGPAVLCTGRSCTVRSSTPAPGVLVGDYDNYGIYGDEDVRRVTLRNLEIEDFYGGSHTRKARVDVTDVDFIDCVYFGLLGGRLRLLNVTAQDTGDYGLGAGRSIRGSNVHVTNSGIGIDNGQGSVRIDGLVAQGNTGFGVFSRSLKLENSTLSGNGIDLSTKRRPRLVATTCERSEQHDDDATPLGTWSVCSLD